MVTVKAFSVARSILFSRYASSSSGATCPRRSRCSTMRSETPKRAAMSATVAPASASAPNASTWSAGCMATLTTFSASESSPSMAPLATMRQGTG